MLLTNDTLMHRIHRELLDHSDEELELELLQRLYEDVLMEQLPNRALTDRPKSRWST